MSKHLHNLNLPMRRILCNLVIFLLTRGYIQAQVDENNAIDQVKQLSPTKLDSSLPSGHFENWLKGIVGQSAKITWELNDCGEQTGDPGIDTLRDIPMCVGVYVEMTPLQRLGITVVVGTNKKGQLPAPGINDIYVESGNNTLTLKRLSDLERTLKHSSSK